jgi:HK97 gp10 family phage protein
MIQKMQGLAELAADFRKLSAGVEAKAARRMVASGAGVVRDEAKRVALGAGLKLTGALIRNIAIKREKTPAGLVQYNIGVRHGRHLTAKVRRGAFTTVISKSGRAERRFENDPWYWAILHGGTKAHTIVASRGHALKIGNRFVHQVNIPAIAPVPFIAIAMERQRANVLLVYSQRLQEFLSTGR